MSSYAYMALRSGKPVFSGDRLYLLIFWAGRLDETLDSIDFYRCRYEECKDIRELVYKEVNKADPPEEDIEETCKTQQS